MIPMRKYLPISSVVLILPVIEASSDFDTSIHSEPRARLIQLLRRSLHTPPPEKVISPNRLPSEFTNGKRFTPDCSLLEEQEQRIQSFGFEQPVKFPPAHTLLHASSRFIWRLLPKPLPGHMIITEGGTHERS